MCNNDRFRCHQTLMNSSRASLGSGGEGDLQFNAFSFDHNPWHISITEMENPWEGIKTQGLWSNRVRVLDCSATCRVPPRGPGISPRWLPLFCHFWLTWQAVPDDQHQFWCVYSRVPTTLPISWEYSKQSSRLLWYSGFQTGVCGRLTWMAC